MQKPVGNTILFEERIMILKIKIYNVKTYSSIFSVSPPIIYSYNVLLSNITALI